MRRLRGRLRWCIIGGALPSVTLGAVNVMRYFSAVLATFLTFILGMMALGGQFLGGAKSWGIWPVAYAIAAAASGWTYVASRVKALAWVHALLMFGIAGVCGFYGLSVLGDRSIAGGRGPDANPVAGIIYGFGLLAVVIAVATFAGGAGVINSVLRSQKGPDASI